MRSEFGVEYNPAMLTKVVILISLVLVALMYGCNAVRNEAVTNNGVAQAFESHENKAQVTGEGTVSRLLADDTSGLPHQRFIVRISPTQTVLIEYNTGVAPRIEDLKVGDSISFAGEYIWNEQGGLVHWTHHDPAGRHQGGWIKHDGRTYQ